jgi:ribonuclease BN (tRNA processing enzyme)
LELIILGAGPAYTDRAGSAGAAYLVLENGHALLLDMGQGSFPALASAWEPSRLDGVLISHLHPDHFIDLVPLRHYLRFEFDPPRRVKVFGPSDLAARLDGLHAEPGFAKASLDIQSIREGGRQQRVGPFTVEWGLVTHTKESYGFRVTIGGSGLVYSGDCGRAEDLRPLIRAGDTLLIEASFGVGPVPEGALHLDAMAVGLLAVQTRPERVLLTHIQMGWDQDQALAAVQAIWSGRVEVVQPGDRFAA